MKKKLTAFCYAIYFAAYLGLSLFAFLYDTVGFATGKLYTKTLKATDFTLVDLEINEDGKLVSYGNDPQLIYLDNSQEIRSVAYSLSAPAKGDVALYYAENENNDFSKKNIVLAAFGETQNLSYNLPLKGIHKIRLDIASFADEEFNFTHDIAINPKRSFISYFSFDISGFAKFLILPLMASSVIIFVLDLAQHHLAQKKVK